VAPRLKRESARAGLVVGVTKFAWMYDKSRDWAERILEEWEEQQLAGTGAVRVFRSGKRRSLFTTLAVIHASMPPGRDLVLYRRMAAVEAEVAEAHRRIDSEILERKRADAELERQIGRRAG
jgi:hypothetical protein